VLQKLGKWAQEHPGVFLALAAAVGVVAAAIIGANIAMTLLAMNPVVLTIMAIVAAAALLTVGLVALYKNSETFRTIVTGAWQAVQSAVKAVVNYLKGPVMAAWDIIKGAFEVIKGIITGDFSAAWDGLKTMIGGVVDWIKTTLLDLPITILTAAASIGKAIVNGIVSGVATLGEMTWNAIKGLPGYLAEKVPEWLAALGNIGIQVITWISSKITGLAAAAWENIQDFPTALWNHIVTVAEGIKTWGGKIIGWIVETFTGLAGDMWEKIKGFPGDVWEKILTLKDTITSWGVKLVKWVVSGIGSMGNAIGKALFGGIDSGGTGSVPPALRPRAQGANGGIVTRPTFALIGEAGPEAVVPLDQMPGAFPLGRGGRGAGGIIINVQAGLVSTPDQIGQQIIEAIQSAQRRSGPVFAAA
jgi:phage-related protein